MKTTEPTFEKLLERYNREREQRRKNSQMLKERMHAAGLKRINLWIPQEIDTSAIRGVLLKNGRLYYQAIENVWKEVEIGDYLKKLAES